MKRDARQGTFSDFPLSPRTFFPQNHTDVISGGDEACTTTSLGKNEHGVVITTQSFLPREGRLIEGGQTDL
jgi:hypothetical protein